MCDNVLKRLWLYHTPGMWRVEGNGSLTTIQGFVYRVSVITVVCGPQSLLSEGLRLKPLNNLSRPRWRQRLHFNMAAAPHSSAPHLFCIFIVTSCNVIYKSAAFQ